MAVGWSLLRVRMRVARSEGNSERLFAEMSLTSLAFFYFSVAFSVNFLTFCSQPVFAHEVC